MNNKPKVESITWGDVAEANKGSNPPQAIIKLSDSWDIKWTALTTKMALSPLLTNSNTDFVLWLDNSKASLRLPLL